MSNNALSTSSAFGMQFSLTQATVLRRAMILLGGAVLAAAAVAYLSLAFGFINTTFSMISIFAVMGMGFVVPRMGDTTAGYALVLVAGGLLGYAIVPTVAVFIGLGKAVVVLQALIATAAIFTALYFYATISKRDFTNIGGLLFVAMIVAVVMSLLNVFFFHSPMIMLIISYVVALASCGLILFRISLAVRGGQISAVSLAFGLLIDVYNLFISLLNILGNRN